ncbi:MAG: alpha/beta hydrolase [Clostridiaceae bacterium]|nr:alpha/beta hydrolase [Clostridiaceae bacterium]
MDEKSITDSYHNPRGTFTRLDTSRFRYKYLDLPYHTESEDQKMDIYLPEQGGKPYPAVVYIHGGGFEMGDRKYGHIAKLTEGLEKGYACVSISYRLSMEKVFPAAVQDVRNGIRYLRKHAEEYGIDPERIGVFGESAGGNLVSLLAMNPEEEVFDANVPEELKGVSAHVAACVDWFGVIEMASVLLQNEENNMKPSHFTPDNCPESRYLGESLLTVPKEWLAKTNPVNYISERMCPILIEHGTGDYQVPVQQSQMLYRAIVEKMGTGRAELFLLEGAVHEDPRFESDENMAAVWAFFNKYLK